MRIVAFLPMRIVALQSPMRITPLEDRFWARVNKRGGKQPHMDTECWLWTGKPDALGYGYIKVLGRASPLGVHRYSAMLHFGMFDRRAQVCHHCDVRNCVRPSHLYLGDHASNMRDMVERKRSAWGKKTHCPKGHPYDDENTLRTKKGGRACRACRRDRHVRDYTPRKKNHCPRGHEYTPENTGIGNKGERRCKACVRAYQQSRRPS